MSFITDVEILEVSRRGQTERYVVLDMDTLMDRKFVATMQETIFDRLDLRNLGVGLKNTTMKWFEIWDDRTTEEVMSPEVLEVLHERLLYRAIGAQGR